MFAIPQEPTINQRFGILIHQVLDRFHAEELRAAAGGVEPMSAPAGGLERLLGLFEAGWRRQGFGSSDDELQYRDRAVAALARYHERHARSESRPVWLERNFSFAIGPHQLRGRVDRVDRHPDGGYELIDYKTGDPGSGPKLAGDVQLALYRLGAREAWQIEADLGSYWYVLADERVSIAPSPTTPSGSSARCSRSPRGSPSRTSSRAPRTRSARGATTASSARRARPERARRGRRRIGRSAGSACGAVGEAAAPDTSPSPPSRRRREVMRAPTRQLTGRPDERR